MKRKRCMCGFMAEVDSWNSKGIVMYCPECGGYEISRDRLYDMAVLHRMTLAFIERYRKGWLRDSEDPDLTDEEYKSACQMAAEMVDEMWKEHRRAEEEWRDERIEEIDYFEP